MMLSLQLILIFILIFTLSALYLDERQRQKSKVTTSRITRFWEGNERRCYVRVDADLPVRYTIPKGSVNLDAIKTKNISVGGICMTLNEKLSMHEILALEIGLPEGPMAVTVKGEIVWVREDIEQGKKDGIRHFDIGIEFRELLPKDKDRLFKFIKEHRKTESAQGSIT